MLRSKVSVHKGRVKESIPGFTVEYQANTRDDLEPSMIARKTVIPITKILPAQTGVNEGREENVYKCCTSSVIANDFDSVRFDCKVSVLIDD